MKIVQKIRVNWYKPNPQKIAQTQHKQHQKKYSLKHRQYLKYRHKTQVRCVKLVYS